jgi:putative OmpL-like beta-barrel porin-2
MEFNYIKHNSFQFLQYTVSVLFHYFRGKGMYMRLLSFISIFLLAILVSSSTSLAEGPTVKFSAYVDAYAATDNAGPMGSHFGDTYQNMREFSIVNSQKNNFGLNVAQITADISYDNLIRGSATLFYGDIMANTKISPDGFPYPMVKEAYAGFMLLENLWIDGGYFSTHIGGESLMPKDNWLSSHSMVTYYEPFFQSGFRASYEAEKLTAQIYILNSANTDAEYNFNKTLGLFFGYQITDKFSASYANVIGNEEPGDPNLCRTHMYHNICMQYDFTEQFAAKAQVDIASNGERETPKVESQSFLGFSVQARYAFTPKYAATFRVASADDKDGIYGIATYESMMGLTLGGEYKPTEFSYFRIEGRMLTAGQDYFYVDGNVEKSRMELMLNMGVWID